MAEEKTEEREEEARSQTHTLPSFSLSPFFSAKVEKNISLSPFLCLATTNLRGDSLALGGLLEDVEPDPLALGQRDHRLVAVADDEDVRQASRKLVAGGVAHLHDVERALVLLAVDDGADAALVPPPDDHRELADVELEHLGHLRVGELENDGVVDLDVGVGVAQRPAVVRRDVGDAAGADLQLLDAEQLVAGLLGADAVANEPALGVVDQAEVLVGAVERDDVHQPRGVGGVGADLPVDLDEALHEDGDDLLAGEGVPAWWVVVKRGGGVGGEREREESGERESKGTGKR